MKRKIIITADGSATIHLEEWDEQYHSKHGAIQEAQHVFIKSGLHHYLKSQAKIQPVRILEIGFGTGLNAFITALEAKKININVQYTGIEAYPVEKSEWQHLNFATLFTEENSDSLFKSLHELSWEKSQQIMPNFSLLKQKLFFEEIEENKAYDLIYFDAFGARVQPTLWEEPIFKKMFNALTSKGILVTYSAKGSARRAMQSSGFIVEKIPGPPGKREMLRAYKP